MYDLRTLITLTNDLILDDIAGFEQRIQIAREKLAVLPEGYLPYTEHKKREKQHRELQADISHIENLIKYAHEGIELHEQDSKRYHRFKIETEAGIVGTVYIPKEIEAMPKKLALEYADKSN